jgi:hypothetical protein
MSVFTIEKFSSFNLLPPKSKEEIEVIEERDNTILYGFLLIFFSVLVFVILSILQAGIIVPKINSKEASVNNLESLKLQFNSVKSINGELFLKSKSLEPILDKDIKITEVLNISAEIIKDLPSTRIISYIRESSGGFTISIETQNYQNIEKILTKAKSISRINKVFLRNMSQDHFDISYIKASLSFSINNLDV